MPAKRSIPWQLQRLECCMTGQPAQAGVGDWAAHDGQLLQQAQCRDDLGESRIREVSVHAQASEVPCT